MITWSKGWESSHFNSYDGVLCFMSSLRFREESHGTRSRKAAVVGGRHWSPVRIGSLRCNKINSQRVTVGGRGCGSRSHADSVSDQGNRVRAQLELPERAYLTRTYIVVVPPIVQQADATLFDSLTRTRSAKWSRRSSPRERETDYSAGNSQYLGISILLRE